MPEDRNELALMFLLALVASGRTDKPDALMAQAYRFAEAFKAELAKQRAGEVK